MLMNFELIGRWHRGLKMAKTSKRRLVIYFVICLPYLYMMLVWQHSTHVLDCRVAESVQPSNSTGRFHGDFPVLIDQPHLCTANGNDSVDIVFLIESAIAHRGRRDAIRSTWASVTKNNSSNFRHVFVFGTSQESSRMRSLEKEYRKFKDVVVTGFHDSYRNLTLKTVSALRWVAQRCKNARFFMKVDDDVWGNTQLMLSLLKNNSKSLQRGLGGQCSDHVKVQRNPKSKWYTARKIIPGIYYAPYCIGLAYAGSVNVAAKVAEVSKDVTLFHIEDVYVGMCLQRLGYGVKHLGRFNHRRIMSEPSQGFNSSVPTIYNVKPAWFRELWNADCLDKV